MTEPQPDPKVAAILREVLARATPDQLRDDERERLAREAGPDADLAEVYGAALEAKLRAHERRFAAAFARFDLDGDGVVTVDEIQSILGLARDDAEAFVAQFDRDADQQVDYEEFLLASLAQLGFRAEATAGT